MSILKILESLLGPSKEKIQMQKWRDRVVQIIVESSEIITNSKNTRTIILRAELMWDKMQELNEQLPNDKFVEKYYDKAKKLYEDMQDSKNIYTIINEGNDLYKKKDLGEKYFNGAMACYLSAIDLMSKPDVLFLGDPPVQPFKRYMAYLKKQKKTDELEKVKEIFQKLEKIDIKRIY